LWDVLFLGDLEDKIATSSEDGTIKVWDLKLNECVMTLRGHASDVWCLTSCSSRDVGFQNNLLLADGNLHIDEANKNAEDDEEQLVLFSGGNDGSVKAWPLSSHAISSPETQSASLNRFAIPHCPLQEAAIGACSRRSNGISSLKLFEDGQWSVICMCNGGIWIVSFSGLLMTASDNDLQTPNHDEPPSSRYGGRERGRGSNPSWHYLGCCDKAVTTADTYFSNEFSTLYDRNGEKSMFTSQSRLFATVVCAHPDGFLTLLEVSAYYKPSNESFEISSERCTWKAHDVRAINVWHACIEEISMESIKNYLITTSVKGICRLWGQGQSQGQGQGQGLGSSVPYNLISEFVTGKGQVATCCMLQKSLLIVGDTRGGISIFNISEEMLYNSQETSSGTPVSPHIFIPSAHGVDLVSCIVANDETGGFFSVGHDGNFNVYDSAGQLTNKLKCLPIKSPDQIHLLGSGSELSIYIGGYLGGQYLVYDIRKGYQVMKIEGGGWKR
jgi:WD40 repeat protein